MKQHRMSECPRCGSKAAGEIAVKSFSVKTDRAVEIKMLNRGQLVRFVSPEDYREYYKPCGINAFCSECGFEFVGTVETVDIKNEDLDNYREEQGIIIPKKLGFKERVQLCMHIKKKSTQTESLIQRTLLRHPTSKKELKNNSSKNE